VVEAELIDELVAETRERTSWELADALAARATEKALRSLRSLLSRKESPIQIFGAVCYRFRQLWIAADLVQRGAASGEVAKAARIPPFAAQKLMEEARRFSQTDFRELWQHLWEADRRLKRSTVRGELVLESLIFRLAPPRPPHAPARADHAPAR
jgi:DNA polymerase-3 subunit delta